MKKFLVIAVFALGTTLQAQDRTSADQTAPQERFIQGEDGWVRYEAYHSNGSVRESGTFLHGKREGTWRQYDAQGQETAQVQFQNDQLHGRAMVSNVDGTVKYRLSYTHGLLEKGEQLDRFGEVVAVVEAP
ncbi:MAG: hypothetical protein KDB88_01275 [Flavobacteriales bacterium]|nr:hypothetical protein [Flavobacteriales bacterium]